MTMIDQILDECKKLFLAYEKKSIYSDNKDIAGFDLPQIKSYLTIKKQLDHSYKVILDSNDTTDIRNEVVIINRSDEIKTQLFKLKIYLCSTDHEIKATNVWRRTTPQIHLWLFPHIIKLTYSSDKAKISISLKGKNKEDIKEGLDYYNKKCKDASIKFLSSDLLNTKFLKMYLNTDTDMYYLELWFTHSGFKNG